MHRFLKPGRLFLYAVAFVFFVSKSFSLFGGEGTIQIDNSISIHEGDTLSDLYKKVASGKKLLSLKLWYRKNQDALSVLQPGTYQFSGTYLYSEFFNFLSEGPQVSYLPITILEGRSVYDVDEYLVKEGIIRKGSYAAMAFNPVVIEKFKTMYDFLDMDGDLVSLEGYLYPETYYIDLEKDVLDQLFGLQLDQFKKVIWDQYQEQFLNFSNNLASKGLDITLGFYDVVILASVIEKEERVNKNKSKIASVFFNRIASGMRIDADITLCYGLGEGYETCTPEIIVENLKDSSNPYNTRAVSGLPPTPISNIHVSSFEGVLGAEKTKNFFYLHDSKGKIYLAKDLLGHNRNKSKYLE